MKYLPVKTLQEIYFKTIILSLIYCILIWGNCSTALFSSLESTHLREARIIFNLDCLLNSHWPSVSYFHKKYVLVFMHKVYFNSLSFWPDELYLKKVSGKPLWAINQIFTPRPRSEVRRNSLRYRGPLIWNYINKMIDVLSSLNSFKASIRKSKADSEAFLSTKKLPLLRWNPKIFSIFNIVLSLPCKWMRKGERPIERKRVTTKSIQEDRQIMLKIIWRATVVVRNTLPLLLWWVRITKNMSVGCHRYPQVRLWWMWVLMVLLRKFWLILDL